MVADGRPLHGMEETEGEGIALPKGGHEDGSPPFPRHLQDPEGKEGRPQDEGRRQGRQEGPFHGHGDTLPG